MPRYFGFGRILSQYVIGEWYLTIRLFGRRLFVAWGKYRGTHVDGPTDWEAPRSWRTYKFRHWLQCDPPKELGEVFL